MATVDIYKSLDRGDQLPVYSLTGQRALKLINKPNPNIKELAQTISADQSLAAKILRVVNSTSYGLPRAVTRVSEALPYVGLEETRRIVLTASAHSLFGGTQSRETWEHALIVAHMAEALHQFAGLNGNPEDAFFAGLLHDVGKTHMSGRYPSAWRDIMRLTDDGATPLEAEKAVFGMDHAEVSGEMLRRWNLPEAMCRAVSCHHATADSVDPLELEVVLADRLDHWMGKVIDDGLNKCTMAYFGLDVILAMALKRTAMEAVSRYGKCLASLW